ncbi:MAG: radical SAM protein [bacterium]|nr:radical SAM protein [bacterium]
MPEKLKIIDGRIDRLYSILNSCNLCPRKCKVNRISGEKGICRAGKEIMVSSYGPHFGEEQELVGVLGSGTIFLTYCNLLCIYCQNYDISHSGIGDVVSEERMASIILNLQKIGCHNINLVTPTHFTPQLVKSLGYAIEKGLSIPIVWNCSGYENVEVIKLLDGIVDIYMPDMKYGESEPAKRYSNAPDYFERCVEAIEEMYKQVGDLKVNTEGIAEKGLLVRHLVLPNHISNSENVLKFIAGLSKNTYINIMDQYRPCGKADLYPEINRKPTFQEFKEVIKIAKSLGLYRGFERL